MHTLERNILTFAIGLSLLAGCVDAIGFMQLGGFFISFMSGNSTRLAVGLQHANWEAVHLLASIIGCFVIGAIIGATVRSGSALKKQSACVLTMVTLLLVIAALCDSNGFPSLSMLLIALAMGAENSVLQSNDETVVGVTYMTGTLVKMGQRIAVALQGGKKFSWIPYLLLWLGLLIGGIIGASLFTYYGFNALWIPTGWAILLTLLMWGKR